jgi:uncharacterized protein RhaS with RHS repeats
MNNVNRLTQLTETGGLGIISLENMALAIIWQRFIDPTSTGVAFDTHEAQSSAEFNSANRQTTASATYDAAGNQTYHRPFTLAYDAENRNTSMTSTSSGSGTFHYDAMVVALKKVWTPSCGPTATTYYAYNVLGQMVAEYSLRMQLGTTYAFVDMLGSVRAVTNETGSVVECYDYLPFGRLLNAGGKWTLCIVF